MLSFSLYFKLDTEMSSIRVNFIKINDIDKFKLNFYRICAMLRDVANDNYANYKRDWKLDVRDSYNQLFKDKNELMFTNNRLKMYFD